MDRLEGGVLMGFDQDEDAVAHMPEDRRFIPVHHNSGICAILCGIMN